MSQTASLPCFILLPLRDILEPKKKSIRLALAMAWNFPCEMYPEAPKAKKSCSSWVLGECHLKAPNTKTNMTNWIQLLTVAVLSTFKRASFFWRCSLQYELIWMGTLWFLAPAGFQSPQRPPAPRQWHAQGQAWRKAAHEHDLAKNPSNFFGSGGSKCAQNILHSGQRICQERCRFQNSLSLPLKLRIWFFIEGLAKPFCIQDRFDIATCGHSQLEVSAKADNGEVYDRYLIFETPRVTVKALHTFWVVYPPKASLKSDILEARYRVRSFNLLDKLLKKAQKESEPLTRSDLASKLGLATTKSYGTGDLISKRVVETVLSILSIQQ